MDNMNYRTFSTAEIEKLLKFHEEQEAFWSKGGTLGYKAAFVLGLIGTMLGIAGVLHGAIGEAGPGEFQLACVALLVGVPAWFMADRINKSHHNSHQEYLLIISEKDRRNSSS